MSSCANNPLRRRIFPLRGVYRRVHTYPYLVQNRHKKSTLHYSQSAIFFWANTKRRLADIGGGASLEIVKELAIRIAKGLLEL